MDYLLHIDCSADLCGIAISGDGILITNIIGQEARNHSAGLNQMIDQALKDTCISVGQLSAIVVCSGPGSYTGLRIAMATAKGICYALNTPLILNDRLLLLAKKSFKDNLDSVPKQAAVVLVAREKEYFVGIFDSFGTCISQPLHMNEGELAGLCHQKENLHIVSDAPVDLFYQLKVNFLSFEPNIKLDYHSWSEFAYCEYKCQRFVNLASATPLYLKQVYTHK